MQIIPTKTDGVSTLPAAEWNQVPLEITNLITGVGQTATSADLNQLAKSVATYVAGAQTFIDTGSASAKVLNTGPTFQNPTAYTGGMYINFQNLVANTGAVTVNVAGLGSRALVDRYGQPLQANRLVAAGVYSMVYNGTQFLLTSQDDERVFNISTNSTLVATTHKNTSINILNGSNSVTITLPAFATIPDGSLFKFNVQTTSTVNFARVQGNGAELIQGLAGLNFYTQGACLFLQKTGTGWKIMSLVDGAITAIQDRPIAQAIATATVTKVQTTRNIGSMQGTPWTDITTNFRVTPQIPGWYLVSTWCTFAANSTGDRISYVALNGGVPGATMTIRAPAVQPANLTPGGVAYFNGTTDYIEAFVYQDSGGSLNLTYASIYVTLMSRQEY